MLVIGKLINDYVSFCAVNEHLNPVEFFNYLNLQTSLLVS